MILDTTLGYIEKDGCYLMMHRTKKKNDINQDKWIGVGGKLEAGETPLDCMKRECFEETGLIWKDPVLRGIVSFNYADDEKSEPFHELMFLYTGSEFEGTVHECVEGDLEWVRKEDVASLPLWRGDLIFFDLLCTRNNLFYLTLDYIGGTLIRAAVDGKDLILEDLK